MKLFLFFLVGVGLLFLGIIDWMSLMGLVGLAIIAFCAVVGAVRLVLPAQR